MNLCCNYFLCRKIKHALSVFLSQIHWVSEIGGLIRCRYQLRRSRSYPCQLSVDHKILRNPFKKKEINPDICQLLHCNNLGQITSL